MIPNNLRFEFEYFCNGCPCMDAVAQQYTIYEDNQHVNINTITCKRLDGCRRVIQHFLENKENK